VNEQAEEASNIDATNIVRDFIDSFFSRLQDNREGDQLRRFICGTPATTWPTSLAFWSSSKLPQ
jgi:hypothetical protein